MTPEERPWRSLPVFREKSPAFLDAVAAYWHALNCLSLQQRRELAVFKAAELLNALIQIRERRQAPDRLGEAFAKASFQRVRQVIRDRRMVLEGGEVIDLRDPVIRDLIDEGCRLFHAGRKDADEYQRALALSAAQCLALNDQLDEGIARYAEGSGLSFPDSLLVAVRTSFIEAYRTA
jgi:hypothetical protein